MKNVLASPFAARNECWYGDTHKNRLGLFGGSSAAFASRAHGWPPADGTPNTGGSVLGAPAFRVLRKGPLLCEEAVSVGR